MKNICEWKNCREFGKFRAPTEKDNSKKFKLLCDQHIKLFNKSWNYFEGMSEGEITNFLKSDITWHRPTQQFGSPDNFFNILFLFFFHLHFFSAKIFYCFGMKYHSFNFNFSCCFHSIQNHT